MNEISTGGARVEARGLGKRFGSREVLRDVDLAIEPGEFVAIVGRSGCGKSTLLRLIAGLENTSAGRLRIEGEDIAGLSEDTRIMFHDSRLLPWRSVWDNVTLGLPAALRPRAADALALVGLAGRGGDWPAQLSCEQRQRASLARTLVHNPRLMLLDEPLDALDALARIELRRLIEGLWQRCGFTALLVTHDAGEGLMLADRVILIEEGRVALDKRITLRRPRSPDGAALAALETRIVDRVAPTTNVESAAGDDSWAGARGHGLRRAA